MKTVTKIHGGKWYLVKRIVSLMPPPSPGGQTFPKHPPQPPAGTSPVQF